MLFCVQNDDQTINSLFEKTLKLTRPYLYSNIGWMLHHRRDIESMMAFENEGNSSKTLDYFVFCNATGITGTQSADNTGNVGITTDGTTTYVETTTSMDVATVNDITAYETTSNGRQK